MSVEKASCDELCGEGRSDATTINEDPHKEIEKEFEERILEEREKKIKEYEAKLEEQKKVIERMKLDYEKLQECVANSRKQNALVESIVNLGVFDRPSSDLGKFAEDFLEPTDSIDNLHPLQRPELEDFLRDVAKELDTNSFLNLMKTCKKFYKLAKNGIIKTNFGIRCATYMPPKSAYWRDSELSPVLVPYYNKKPLGDREKNFLRKCRYFIPTMKSAILTETNTSEFPDAGKNLIQLCRTFGVKTIDALYLDANTYIPTLLQRLVVKELNIRVASGKLKGLLSSPHIEKLESLHIDVIDFRRNDRDVTRISEFLLCTKIARVKIDIEAYWSITAKLILMWKNGQKNIRKYTFLVGANLGNNVAFELKQSGCKIEHIDLDLTYTRKERFQELVSPIAPSTVYVGRDGGIVAVNDNLQMIRMDHFEEDNEYKVVLTSITGEFGDDDEEEEEDEEEEDEDEEDSD